MAKYLFGLCLLPALASGQGETTSAIAGVVLDQSKAGVPDAVVTVRNTENGLKRSVKTDPAGRFTFPQLQPGVYRVSVEADGFATQQQDSVTAGLGQTQTVNFTLVVAAAKQDVLVNGDAPLVNTENPNTSTTMNAKTLEDLPNPGGDLTYPLQFAAGALINTAGSGNDFVGGTNGYGNVEFNGLPALANGYIVDGLETNDPLTNLNSGLATNLVLGLNSIAEVTVNTLSYAVDQGRYGAAQVNYVTKSGTNRFHGNLYELWNGSKFNAADFFTNATAGNHKPRSTVNHFGGSLGGPIRHDKLFFFFDSEWVRIALPIVTPATVPTPAFQSYVLGQLPLGGKDSITGSNYQPEPQLVHFYQKMFSLYKNTSGTPLAIQGCPFNSDGSAAAGNPPNGNGCANRQSISHSSDDHEQVQTGRVDDNIDPNNIAWFRFQSDSGAADAYTDPINPVFNAVSSQPLYSFAAGYTHIFSPHLVNYFNPAFSWYSEFVRPAEFTADPGGVTDRAPRHRGERSVHAVGRVGQHLGAGAAGGPILHQRQPGVEPRGSRISLWSEQQDLPVERLRFWRGHGSDRDVHGPARVHLRSGLDCDGHVSLGRLAALSLSESGFLRAGHVESDIEARPGRLVCATLSTQIR